MKAIMPNLSENTKVPLYLQIYEYIKSSILSNEIVPGEKLPSLRNLSDTLNVSITTVDLAYAQLNVEGYIYSKPQSGYYVSDIKYHSEHSSNEDEDFLPHAVSAQPQEPDLQYDLDCFDFNKWKKCINKVFTQYPHLLMFESDPQGEEVLRQEISKYVYTSRGVKCSPSQIVIAAGTQQITGHLSTILKKMDVNNVAVEIPGYLPVTNIFRDRGFTISHIPVLQDGIDIDKLPANISSAVYVNPSNQFPTGAVMPIGKRYRLLDWAQKNKSYIIEDDYDSELRYFGRPIPSLQGLDTNGRVIYLGSFSSTLFPSAKISYMVLPEEMSAIFDHIRNDYSQTCSKTEQLALAFFMEEGKYQIGIKKLRRLYSQKLNTALAAFNKYAKDFITPINTASGINMILSVKNSNKPEELAATAQRVGLQVVPANIYTEKTGGLYMIFYYNQVPLRNMDSLISQLTVLWRSLSR